MLDDLQLASLVGENLPAGLFWRAPLIYAVGSGALLFFTAFLWARVCLREFHSDSSEHWTQRARYLHAVSGSAGRVMLVAALLSGSAAGLLHGPLTPVPLRAMFVVLLLTGFVGAYLGMGSGISAVRRRPLSAASRWRALGWWLFVLHPVLPIWLVMFALMPMEPGFAAFGVFALGQGLLLLVIRGGHLPLLRAIGILRPAPEIVVKIVGELAQDLGRAAPRCYEVAIAERNAVAFPACQTLGVTSGLLEAPTRDLRAILAHEFGHLQESRRSTLLRWLGGASVVSYPLVLPAYGMFGPLGALGIVIGVFFIVRWMVKFSVRLESEADEVARTHEADPGDYARALESLCQYNLIPAVGLGKPVTHPHLYDRLLAAGVTPEYPRPEPPSRKRLMSVRIVFLLPLLLYAGFGWTLHRSLVSRPSRGAGGARTAVTLTGGAPEVLYALAWERAAAGEYEQAIELGRLASDLLPDPPSVLHLAFLLDFMGHKAEGLERLRAALEAGPLPPDPQFHTDLGLYYLSCGEPDLAREALSRAQTRSASAEFFLGSTDYVKLGFLLRDTGSQMEGQAAIDRGRDMARESGSLDEFEEFVEAMKARPR